MPRIEVSYGPPRASGVDTIMGIGAEDVGPGPLDSVLTKAAWVGAGIWAIGVVLRKSRMQGFGLGVAACGLGVKYLGDQLTEAEVKKTVAAVVPGTATAGWFDGH